MKAVFAAVLTLPAVTIFAQKPITGAFGYQLGKKLDQAQILSAVSEYVYQVKPVKPFRNFTAYVVIVGPGTREVIAIAASCFPAESEVAAELDICRTALEKIYGPFQKTESGFMLKNGGRSIRIGTIRDQNGPVLSILYQDDRMTAKAERELKEKPVQGAFGFKFGDQLDQSVIISEVDKNWFQVRPGKPSPIFAQYGCEVTPKSKRIFAIHGIRPLKDLSEIDTIADMMISFYGSPKSKEKDIGKLSYSWQKGRVSILLYNTKKDQIWISFTNDNLAAAVESERKQLELEKTDSSAL